MTVQRRKRDTGSDVTATGQNPTSRWQAGDRSATVRHMQPTPFAADPHLHDFLIDCRDAGQSPETLKLRRHVLTTLVRVTKLHLLAQTPESLHVWFRSFSAHAPATRRCYATAVRAFYAWAVRRHLTDSDPSAALPVPRVPAGHPRPISVDDARTALTNAAPRMRLWLLLSMGGGLRAAEVARMRREEMDGQRLTVIGKGAKEREVTLPPLVAAELAAWRTRPGRMWLITPHYVSVSASKFFDELGLPWRFHSCRHAHASWLYESSGGDLLLTAKQLGHSNIRTTQGYAKTSTPKLITSVAALDAVMRGEAA